jgi:hypothetical protein
VVAQPQTNRECYGALMDQWEHVRQGNDRLRELRGE